MELTLQKKSSSLTQKRQGFFLIPHVVFPLLSVLFCYLNFSRIKAYPPSKVSLKEEQRLGE
jgi:hypothetical protein